jgi:hypothetical protein
MTDLGKEFDERGVAKGGLQDAARQADGLTASIAHRQAKEEELRKLRETPPIIGRRPR